jgi:hypothetical protein
MVDRSIVVMGERFIVRWMRYKNSFPAQEYLHDLASDSEKVEARLLSLAGRIAEHGSLADGTHGHQLGAPYEEIFEFKPHAHRFMAFFDGCNIYLTNGAPKKNKKAQQSDYAIAEKMRKDFFQKKISKKGSKQ